MDKHTLYSTSSRNSTISLGLERVSRHLKRIHEKSSQTEGAKKLTRALLLFIAAAILGNLAHERTLQKEFELNRARLFPRLETLETLLLSTGLTPLDSENSHTRNLTETLPRYFATPGEIWTDSTARAIAVSYLSENETAQLIWVDTGLKNEKLIWSQDGIGLPTLELAMAKIYAQKKNNSPQIQGKSQLFQDPRQLHY